MTWAATMKTHVRTSVLTALIMSGSVGLATGIPAAGATCPPNTLQCEGMVTTSSDSAGSWKIICMSRLIVPGERPAISRPANLIDPDTGLLSPTMVFPRVVFPHPLSPMSPSVYPVSTESETPSTALHDASVR